MPYPYTIGAISYDEECLERHKKENKCIGLAYYGNCPTCAVWGSATPQVILTRECTFKEMKECPLAKQYPDEKVIKKWRKWLKKKNLMRC